MAASGSAASRRRHADLRVVFLALFVVYYAINWKYLSSVWPLS